VARELAGQQADGDNGVEVRIDALEVKTQLVLEPDVEEDLDTAAFRSLAHAVTQRSEGSRSAQGR
jgi:hypothetical protein